jgi:hypothetical protein
MLNSDRSTAPAGRRAARKAAGILAFQRTDTPLIVGLVVGAVALLRMPLSLRYEEGFEFWDKVPVMTPVAYVLEPWAGYLNVFARSSFLVAHALDPIVTRLLAAAVIGLLAAFVVRASTAIPNPGVRLAFALVLPLLPIPDPGPYLGPLNSQWWIALLVLLIALEPERRWHSPLLLTAGLTGLAPCLAVMAFRDLRGFALLAPAIAQAVVFIGQPRRPLGVAISSEFMAVATVLLVTMAIARLPRRTRLAFTYLGLVIILGGSLAVGGESGNWRYLGIPAAGIALGLISLVNYERDRLRANNRSGRVSARDVSARTEEHGDPVRT